jgi:hypothetical protein
MEKQCVPSIVLPKLFELMEQMTSAVFTRTRSSVVSGARQQYWDRSEIHILCSWRYTRQTRYVNIAFRHMHLLVNNRRELVRHLLQELLVLQTVSIL